MHELVEALVGESYAAVPKKTVEGLTEEQVHAVPAGSPRSIYAELWHICFWTEMSLKWMHGIEAPYPENTAVPFPTEEQTRAESWEELCVRFERLLEECVELAGDAVALNRQVVCTSRPGDAPRTMTVLEQLISVATHNAYHLGRVVLLRQMLGNWPPPGGGFAW